jgi:methionine salvage enolase-phosphatase E1
MLRALQQRNQDPVHVVARRGEGPLVLGVPVEKPAFRLVLARSSHANGASVDVIDVFDRRFSVDETVRRHKPAQEAYHSVATALGIDPGGICLIASHVWDTIGAAAAGWQTALILREGNAPLDVGPQPDYIGKDLDAIADQLIERYLSAEAQPGRR